MSKTRFAVFVLALSVAAFLGCQSASTPPMKAMAGPAVITTTDRLEIMDKDGKARIILYANPKPFIEVITSEGKVYQLDAVALARRASLISQE